MSKKNLSPPELTARASFEVQTAGLPLAYLDEDFLDSDEGRPIRILSE